MSPLRARAGRKAIDHGGEKKSRSTARAIAGTAWKEQSAVNGRGGAQSGRTSCGSMALSPQYSRVIRHSMGALATLRVFLKEKRVWDAVRSARSATVKVAVASARPNMVRNWKCPVQS